MPEPRIELDQRERALFDLVLRVDRDRGLGQSYRVAGGWVRDKLLGRATDDVDIALDRMTGRAGTVGKHQAGSGGEDHQPGDERPAATAGAAGRRSARHIVRRMWGRRRRMLRRIPGAVRRGPGGFGRGRFRHG